MGKSSESSSSMVFDGFFMSVIFDVSLWFHSLFRRKRNPVMYPLYATRLPVPPVFHKQTSEYSYATTVPYATTVVFVYETKQGVTYLCVQSSWYHGTRNLDALAGPTM
jgi:hypothetical protein